MSQPGLVVRDIIFAFPTVGFSHNVLCYSSQDAACVSLSDVRSDWGADAVAVVDSQRPGPWDEEILQAGMEDEEPLGGPFWIEAPDHRGSDCTGVDPCLAIQPGINAQLLWQAKRNRLGPFALTEDLKLTARTS